MTQEIITRGLVPCHAFSTRVHEPLDLALFGQMKPEFQYQSPFIDQHGFKTVDLIRLGVEFLEGDFLQNALANRVRVP